MEGGRAIPSSCRQARNTRSTGAPGLLCALLRATVFVYEERERVSERRESERRESERRESERREREKRERENRERERERERVCEL
jgi:membrane protein involved in colicin uptake